jgi:hypothetical protein
MTPELTLLLVGAVVGLLGALTYSWRAYSDVQKLRADAEHVKAQTAKQDNDNMSQLIAYTGRLTVAIDNIAGGLHGVETSSHAQTEILKALVDETKATRADLKAWPELVSLEIKGMRGQVGRVEQSVALLIGAAEQQREEALAVKEALLIMTDAIDKLVQHVQEAATAASTA